MKRRILYHVPIVHTEVDLGSLAGAARQDAIRALGPDAWTRKQAVIAQFWNAVRRWTLTLPADLTAFRIYQDGLPICGRERAIVDDLALQGSENHKLIVDLLARGATLEGTESAALLLEEYTLAKETLTRGAPSQVRAAAILRQRDRFIAKRIDETLKQGETGVLFIGMLHDVLTALPPMIDVHRVAPASDPGAEPRATAPRHGPNLEPPHAAPRR